MKVTWNKEVILDICAGVLSYMEQREVLEQGQVT